MIKLFFIFILISLFTINVGRAQLVQDALTFSQTRDGYATARSAAMGGALASLGADISSVSYNPAGLGMYQNSEFVFVPQILSITKTSKYMGQNNTNTIQRFNASVGGVVHFGSPISKSSFSLAFVYNRLADFSGRYYVNGTNEPSMANIYAKQLINYAQPPNSVGELANKFLNNNYVWNSDPASLTNAILAFRTGMVDTSGNTFISKMIGGNVQNTATILTSGYIDEYAFSGGYSYNNYLFLGLTVGLQNFYYYRDMQYEEADAYNNNATEERELSQKGYGVNIKLGVVVKPTEYLRLGFAFHTPTFYAITENTATYTTYNDGNDEGPIYASNYSFSTPYKFIFGVSYNILHRLTLSADYQLCTYNLARFGNTADANLLNNGNATYLGVKDGYRSTNNVRIGLEYNLLQWVTALHTNFLLVRAGYNFYQSPYTTASGYNGLEQYNYYTAGIGYRGNVFFADFAMVVSDRVQNFRWYMPNGYDDRQGTPVTEQVFPRTSTINFMCTLGFRF